MPTTIQRVLTLIEHLLTSTADRLAAANGFVQRVSTLSGSLSGRMLVFSWWATPAAPL